MRKADLTVLKARIVECYDPDYLVDVLRITSEELLDSFEDKLLANLDEFSELEDKD